MPESRRLVVVVLTLAAVGGVGGVVACTDRDDRPQPVSLDRWTEVHERIDATFDKVIDGGDAREPVPTLCTTAKEELAEHRDTLANPADDQLKKAVAPFLRALDRYYGACVTTGGKGDEQFLMPAVESGEPVVARLRALGYSI
jgi:hypothetical protein